MTTSTLTVTLKISIEDELTKYALLGTLKDGDTLEALRDFCEVLDRLREQ